MAATQTKSSRFISGFGAQVLIAMVAGLGLGLLARQLGPAEGQAGYVLAETLRQVGQIDLRGGKIGDRHSSILAGGRPHVRPSNLKTPNTQAPQASHTKANSR